MNSYPPPIPDAPPPLDLRSEGPSFAAGFFAGLLIGTIVSAVVWIGGWPLLNGPGWLALFLVPVAKIVAGVILTIDRRRRSVGIGLLVSLALGFLIFFGTCVSHFDKL